MRRLLPYIQKYAVYLHGLLLGCCVLTGCIKDDYSGGNNEQELVGISFASGQITDPNFTTDPDDIVSEFRVMAFGSADGKLYLNKYFDFTTNFSNPIEIQIYAGTYDIIFIANEKSDNNLHLSLDAMDNTSQLSQLESSSFASTAFNSIQNIPMASVYRNIEIDAVQGLSEDGITFIAADQTTPWEVEIERLGLRADITLQTKFATVAQDFQALQFDNIPDKVYILSQDKSGTLQYNTGSYEITPRNINLSDGDTGYTSGMILNNSTNTYEWKKTRVILPKSIFPDKTDESQGVQMTAKYNTANDQTAALGPLNNCSDGDHCYNLPGNHYLTVNGMLNLNIDLTLDVMNWKTALDESLNVGPVYRLTLSQSSFTLANNSAPVTLTITTNYKGGWTAELSSDATSVIAPDTSLTLSQYLGTAGDTNVVLTRDPSHTSSDTVYIHITAGNLTAIVQISLLAAGVAV
ncbi:MAG: hypothetical protein LUE98_01505 [Tannerellaceae bacterium]|nr:hypothetical protein [Tannerellaceae bacterium]